jgi:hypothetical protein
VENMTEVVRKDHQLTEDSTKTNMNREFLRLKEHVNRMKKKKNLKTNFTLSAKDELDVH